MSSYELSHAADRDIENIVTYTTKQWGVAQTKKYTKQLANCMEALAQGKAHFKTLEGLEIVVRVTHCQHHYIFGQVRNSAPLLILAVYHERMETMQRLRNRLGD